MGHVSRQMQKQERWTGRIINWYLKEGRKKVKQKKRWNEEITNFLNNQLQHTVAMDKQEWARLSETFALPFQQNL